MTTKNNMTAGDFSGLAKNYSENRPDYSKSVLNAILGLINKPIGSVDFVDVGAGTGIWSRMVSDIGCRSVRSVEPNEDMRNMGKSDSRNHPIEWIAGSAEATGLDSNSCDWLSMASSFHWTDFDKATEEFHRVLRDGGLFTAIWNPRLIEVNPKLVEIENYLGKLKSDIKRVSSGRSGLTNELTEKLFKSKYFDDVIYIEGRHVIPMSKERYVGAWKSVNDLRSQLGEQDFEKFLSFIDSMISEDEIVEATYLTRSWTARKV